MEGEDKEEPNEEEQNEPAESEAPQETNPPPEEKGSEEAASKAVLLEAADKDMPSEIPLLESKIQTGENNLIPLFNSTNDNKIPLNEIKNTQILEKAGGSGFPGLESFPCVGLLHKRSPFIHNPPQPEERRTRIQNPRTPKEYIINLREDLADFQESHGLPRTRDYSFLSLGLALAQETARAVCSLFLMFAELFPILAIVSLILRFALDKLIEILETTEPVPKLKKAVIFGIQMLMIVIPLWILVGTIIIPVVTLVFSIFKKMLRLKGGFSPFVYWQLTPLMEEFAPREEESHSEIKTESKDH